MSSRRAKKPWLRLPGTGRKKINGTGLAKSLRAQDSPIGRAMLSELPPGSIIADEAFEGMGITMPDDEVQVIKEVPAKVDGTVVGTAYIHDDGSVAIRYDEDAPQWALDKIKATEEEVGYSLEAGGPTDG